MAESKESKVFYGYVVVAVAFLLMLVMWGTYYAFGVFFKPLLEEFGWTRAMTSGAFSLSFFLTGLLGIFTGRLTDRFGPRIVVTVCGFFLGLGYLLVSQTNTFWQLYLFYGVVVAMGMSTSVVPLQSTVVRWFVKRRGMMNGIVSAGIGMGMVVMPPIANWLISIYGWRTSYLVIGITASILIILLAQFLRRDPGQLGLLPYGESESKAELNLPETGFSFWEALHTSQLWILVVAWYCFCISVEAVLVHIVPHAIGLGISAASAAGILAFIGGLGTGGRVVMGAASDKISIKLSLIIGFSLLSASFFWLLVAREAWLLYLFVVPFSFGYGGLAALTSPVVAERFGLRSHGLILGVVIFGGTLGEASGPVVAGYIFDITGGYHLAFLTCALISAAGLMLVLLLKSTGKEETPYESGRSS